MIVVVTCVAVAAGYLSEASRLILYASCHGSLTHVASNGYIVAGLVP